MKQNVLTNCVSIYFIKNVTVILQNVKGVRKLTIRNRDFSIFLIAKELKDLMFIQKYVNTINIKKLTLA